MGGRGGGGDLRLPTPFPILAPATQATFSLAKKKNNNNNNNNNNKKLKRTTVTKTNAGYSRRRGLFKKRDCEPVKFVCFT